jgi:5'-3' exonuclease
MDKVLLLVDLNNQSYKHSAAHSMLTSGRHFTGGLYGTLVSVMKAVREVEATHLVFCDDVKPYVRASGYTAYKGDRAQDEILVMKHRESRTHIQSMLEHLEIPLWKSKGFECDDVMSWAVQTYRNRFDRIVAMTNDSDLYQMFRYPNFLMYKGKDGLYGRGDFFADHPGLEFDDIVPMLAMVGTHNAVAGIPRIGPATALKILNDPLKRRKVFEEHKDLIDRNCDLIRLPHPQFIKTDDFKIVNHRINERSFIRWLSTFEIEYHNAIERAVRQLNAYGALDGK